jgi:hypothetical protein
MAVNGLDTDLAAEHGLMQADRQIGMDIVTVAAEDVAGLDPDLDIGVAFFSATALASLALKAQFLAVLDTCGDVNA